MGDFVGPLNMKFVVASAFFAAATAQCMSGYARPGVVHTQPVMHQAPVAVHAAPAPRSTGLFGGSSSSLLLLTLMDDDDEDSTTTTSSDDDDDILLFSLLGNGGLGGGLGSFPLLALTLLDDDD